MTPPATPVECAVLLAAGVGRRLGERGRDRPKGFLRLGARPIVEESLERLRSAGVERVVVVTGHAAEHYEDLRRRLGAWIECVHNPRYADSGSLYSLARAAERIEGDCLLVESDLVYEARALDEVLAAPGPDALLLSDFTGAGDEVFVEADAGGRLVDMSKDRSRLGSNVVGELVGITRVSRALLAGMVAWGEQRFRETLHLDYEVHGLVEASRAHPVPCVVSAGLAWAEIDDERALERARREVYPRIAARGASPG